MQEHRAALSEENCRHLASDKQGIFFAFCENHPIGVAHVSLRQDYVVGTRDDGRKGYLEAIFVEAEHRLQDVGRGLLAECRKWAVEQSCVTFASDCKIDDEASYRFHVKTGFEEVSRNVHFVMPLFEFGLEDE
jgi:aminoglycoside 6'-N-acetyltransferase I